LSEEEEEESNGGQAPEEVESPAPVATGRSVEEATCAGEHRGGICGRCGGDERFHNNC
jgi:hypothetical protein